jgi:DNA-directed RNA polymerase specialized sigma24 family protein
MIAVRHLTQSEFRERATAAILRMLADLPDIQRNIFVWNHYCGYQPKQIAEILKCSPQEVEATLNLINSTLYQRTRSLLADRSEVSKN